VSSVIGFFYSSVQVFVFKGLYDESGFCDSIYFMLIVYFILIIAIAIIFPFGIVKFKNSSFPEKNPCAGSKIDFLNLKSLDSADGAICLLRQ